MADQIQHNGRIKSAKSQRTERLSPDGLWQSFPKVPGLLCYVKSGVFYGRLKVRGKLIRRALHEAEDPISFSTAKLKLADFIKTERTPKKVFGTFGQAQELYEADLKTAHDIGENTKRYRRYCIDQIAKTWPGLAGIPLASITEADCKEWAARLAKAVHATYFNNTLGTFRAILKHGGLTDNPALKVKRLGVHKTELKLPEPDQFNILLTTIENAGGRESKNCADFVRFLAFSGCRISEAHQVTWADVDFKRGQFTVRNAKTRKGKNSVVLRQVPIIPDMAALLEKLKQRNPAAEDKVCLVAECEKSLTRACKVTSTPRITHHDLRHLFATRCIEAGVDIPTVAGWLGHSDGGVLAMQVYGHLRNSHSIEMAQRVKFSGVTAKEETK